MASHQLRVLMVAEKPSLAGSIADILSNGRCTHRRAALDVHEFDGSFLGRPARFKMTSVIGHVFSLDFTAQYNNWDRTDPLELFEARTQRNEANPKAHVVEHLGREAKGMDHLVLWLDCDREGENICFEVMDCTVQHLRAGGGGGGAQRRVHRARFSAITAPEIRAAMASLGEPNQNEALAVDARQELDLRVGVAFTRFQTKYFQGKFGNIDSSLLSYGPCQTPTLNFCVERHQAITSFQPEPFWVVRPHASKGGQRLELEWDRGRLFDENVATVYATLVREARRLVVREVTEKEERRQRPPGLNTVEMLKVASSMLGMGPQHTMATAERLYISGYISYPRTESSAYPPNFDLEGTAEALRHDELFGDYARALLARGITRPQGGVDQGDHPPITPVRAASEGELGGSDMFRLYEMIARHFLGSISPDAVLRKTKATLAAAGEVFHAHGTVALKPGFTSIMPWKAVQNEPLPALAQGEQLDMKEVELHQSKTTAPDELTEAELIGLMEKHGIGTDASISVHINNVCERGYVKIEAGRRVVASTLGITLIRGYQTIDPELCRPQVRAHVEAQIGLVAAGKADKASVVAHTLDQFRQKFIYFVLKISLMDALFEASFSPLSSSGKPLSKCGKCRRFMKLISSRPTRLFCPTCDEIYNLPQGGAIKLYKGLTCPLDGFETVLFTLSGGADAKTYPLCPFCYNYPPFEGVAKLELGRTGGMACTMCPHPTCPHSLTRAGVLACPDCSGGVLCLDPVSGPNWRLDCNLCSVVIYLPANLHACKVSKDVCEECGSKLLDLDWRKGHAPEGLTGAGSTVYRACVACDEELQGLCKVLHGRSFARRGGRGGGRGRGGRGRGRGGRGRGRGRSVNPLMSFELF